ncbi:MAG: GAF domain-containing protein [Acetobacteraceae bacterium]|nr:GAF domain-containing protein [Acetobacteraceae bacterium]
MRQGGRPVDGCGYRGQVGAGGIQSTGAPSGSVPLEYMRNTGTAAAMLVSPVMDGRLWGLISCHHGTPRRVSRAMRTAWDSIGQCRARHLGKHGRMDEAVQSPAAPRRLCEKGAWGGSRLQRYLRARSLIAGAFCRIAAAVSAAWI